MIHFTCSSCTKYLRLELGIFQKAYEGHETCLSCRQNEPASNKGIDVRFKKFTEEELKFAEEAMKHYPDALPTLETWQRYINVIRAQNNEIESLNDLIKDQIKLNNN